MANKYFKMFFNFTEKAAKAIFITFGMLLALPSALIGSVIAVILEYFVCDRG